MKQNFLPILILVTGIVFLGPFTGCGDEEEDSEFCQIAKETYGNPTQSLGDVCVAGGNTGCSITYNNCIEGDCKFSEAANIEICTFTCSSDSDCSGTTPYCSDGVCQAGATCETFCDGTLCCQQEQDPNDPTQCVQTTCFSD